MTAQPMTQPNALGPEPEGFLVRKAEIFAWLPWLTRWHWRRVRGSLSTYTPPGGTRPYYRREEIRAKIVEPMLKGN
jgi:hypothetical protein